MYTIIAKIKVKFKGNECQRSYQLRFIELQQTLPLLI